MAKRLAITIAGAVSLGSYEAGVMWEVLDAIRQHNGLATADSQKIVVDVVTGASAGGMTAIILAHKLLYAGNEFKGPYDNPLYSTWVKRIDLSGLQNTDAAKEDPLHSLLSSDLIVQISKETLLARYAAAGTPPAIQHESINAASTTPMRVGVALTNLDGVDYGYDVHPNGQFVYREYADEMTRRVDGHSDNKAFWEPLRQAAVACGAFPIAFRPQDVERDKSGLDQADYDSPNMLPWFTETQPSVPTKQRLFTYTDGGVLQNQPIGMAKNLVDEVDNHQDQENRFYLFVSPRAKDAAKVSTFHEADADYVHLAIQLMKVVIGQAGFRDWITALNINDRIALMDTRATELAALIAAGGVDVRSLQTTATTLMTKLYPAGSILPPGATQPELLPAAQARIGHQYSKEIGDLLNSASGQPGADAFRDSMVAFEAAAGLGARDTMTIYGVTATDAELAGTGVASFVGFFDQVFRDHDYDVGRMKAREFLVGLRAPQQGGIGAILFDPQVFPWPAPGRPPVPNPALDGLSLAGVKKSYPADLTAFENGLKRRVDQMIDKIGVFGLARPVVKHFGEWMVDLLIGKLAK